MQRRSMSRISSLAVSFAIVSAMLASGVSAQADSGDKKGCSNQTLNGNYGSRADGLLLPAPGVSLPFRALTMTHFDGRGNISWVEHTVINGTLVGPDWTTASGTYDVNPDCTGTATVNTPNSPVPLVLGMVIVKNGNEVDTVLDSHAIISVFNKVDQ